MAELAEVYQISKRVARKEHRCEDCRGKIPIGEKYNYHHGIFDGSGFSFKSCYDCEELREEINLELNFDEMVCVGELGEAVFSGDNKSDIKRFIEIMIRRGCPVKPWMKERLEDSENKA